MRFYTLEKDIMPVTKKEIRLADCISEKHPSTSYTGSPLRSVKASRLHQNFAYQDSALRKKNANLIFPNRNRTELFVPNINLNKRIFQNGLSRSSFCERSEDTSEAQETNGNMSPPTLIPSPSTESASIDFKTRKRDQKNPISQDLVNDCLESFSDAVRKECKALGRDSKCLRRQSALLWGDLNVEDSHRNSLAGTSDNGTISTAECDADSFAWDTATSATTEEDDTTSDGTESKRFSFEAGTSNNFLRLSSPATTVTTEEDDSTSYYLQSNRYSYEINGENRHLHQTSPTNTTTEEEEEPDELVSPEADFKRLSIDASVRKVVVRDGSPIISNLEINDEVSEDGSRGSERETEDDTASFMEKTNMLEHSMLDYICSPTSVLRDNGTTETVTIDLEFWVSIKFL